jgi:tricorn protease-like protein
MTIRRVADGFQQEIPYTGENEFVSFPQLSDDGKYFLGVGYIGSNSHSQIILYDTTEQKTKIVDQNEIIWPSDDVAWANNDDMAAIGAEDETITNENGSCPNYVLIYDMKTQKTRTLVHLPNGKCFDMFLLHGTFVKYPNNIIWSPNNQYIELVIKQNELCLIEVDTGNYGCHPSDPSWGMIVSIAWSPDSEWIAYNTSENHVILFSVQNDQFIELGDMGNLNIGWLVWTTATQ